MKAFLERDFDNTHSRPEVIWTCTTSVKPWWDPSCWRRGRLHRRHDVAGRPELRPRRPDPGAIHRHRQREVEHAGEGLRRAGRQGGPHHLRARAAAYASTWRSPSRSPSPGRDRDDRGGRSARGRRDRARSGHRQPPYDPGSRWTGAPRRGWGGWWTNSEPGPGGHGRRADPAQPADGRRPPPTLKAMERMMWCTRTPAPARRRR